MQKQYKELKKIARKCSAKEFEKLLQTHAKDPVAIQILDEASKASLGIKFRWYARTLTIGHGNGDIDDAPRLEREKTQLIKDFYASAGPFNPDVISGKKPPPPRNSGISTHW